VSGGPLFTLSDDRGYLIAVRVLDGIAAGAIDALLPLILADIMRSTGRYNLSRGFVGTVQGVGGSLSNVVEGSIVVWGGLQPGLLAAPPCRGGILSCDSDRIARYPRLLSELADSHCSTDLAAAGHMQRL
jgi:MFS family permease